VPARRRLDGNIFKFGARFGRKSEKGLNCSLLPILGKMLVVRQPALDHRLLPGGAAASARGGRRRHLRA